MSVDLSKYTKEAIGKLFELSQVKAANSEVANKLFANMSSRMAQSIRDDLEITTNVRIKDVEAAQQRIVDIIRNLEERNEIIILKGGKDDIIA